MNAVRSGDILDKDKRWRLAILALGCVLALIAGGFISSYRNALTATIIIAAIAIFAIAIFNPKAGLYLLMLTTGYVDLAKRLGILAGDLEFSDVVIALAVPPILFGCVCLGVVLQHRRLQRWQWGLLGVVALLMVAVLLQDLFRSTGLLAGLQDFA